MHSTDKRTQFIELRAQGWSIHKISRTIDVPKSTLAHWQKQEQPRIDELKQMADEAREEELLETIQRDQEKVSARLALVEQQLDEQLQAKVESLSLMELCRLSSALRSQLHKSKTGHFRTKPDASKAPDVRKAAPETNTEQNGLPSLPVTPKPCASAEALAAEGTTSAENGTSLPMPVILKHETLRHETRPQLPPRPPAPPERMIGHKIDPSKIVGRKTFASAS